MQHSIRHPKTWPICLTVLLVATLAGSGLSVNSHAQARHDSIKRSSDEGTRTFVSGFEVTIRNRADLRAHVTNSQSTNIPSKEKNHA